MTQRRFPYPRRRVVAGAAVALLLPTVAACGGSDDDNSSAGSKTPSSAADYPALQADPATGTTIKGDGYRYHLPAGWQDISAQLKATQPSIDSGGRARPLTEPFTANLNVLSSANQVTGTLPTLTQLKDIADQIKAEILPLAPDVTQLSPVEVDGAPTLRQQGAASNDGSDFYLVQYYMVTQGSSFGFTFAYPRSTTAAQRDKVAESVLASVTLTK